MVPVEAGVQQFHFLVHSVVVGAVVEANDNAIRVHEIFDRSAFFQEFRV